MKRALITGITGQDGSYLAEFLLDKRYEVHGLVRRSSQEPLSRIPLDSRKRIKIHHGNLRDISSITKALEESQPDEVYNLAAQSHVGLSFRLLDETHDVCYNGVGRIVQEAININPRVRIYQASTSEMFGNSPAPQSEQTTFNPQSPYAKAKTDAHNDFIVYSRKKGFFTCSGFLFNHESPRRGENFVTRKITKSLAEVKLGLSPGFSLGYLGAKRDWGFAGDYVEAMHLMLQQEKPEDFVIATGQNRTVKDFVNATAKVLEMDLEWVGSNKGEQAKWGNNTILSIDEKHYRPNEVNNLLGDASKAERVLRWTPKVSFDELVEMMAEADLNKLKKEHSF